MSTSGSYDWGLTAETIINEACENLKIISPGGTPATAIQTSMLAVLNRITKALSIRGIRIWSVDWTTKTFSAPSEVTGTDTNIYSCIRGHTSATTNRPITGANYTSYWYETGSTGGVWANLTAYTTPGDFDVDAQTINVLKAFIRENNSDTPLDIVSIQEYFDISDKYSDGKPTALVFDKLGTLNVANHIYLYPQPDFENYADYVLHYLAETKLEDFDAVANDPDFSSLFLDFLVKQLTYEASPKYTRDMQERLALKADAELAFKYLKRGEKPLESEDFIKPLYRMR